MKTYLQKHNNIKYSDHYATPEDIYNHYVIDMNYYDPCPLHHTDFNFSQLNKPLFINPPYSEISQWVHWAIIENRTFYNHIVLLIPSRTDTKYFHKLLEYGVDLEFIKGRLKFNGMKTGAPFPSVLVHLQSK